MEEFTFKNRTEWRKWLTKNHNISDGIWLIYYKKHTDKETVNYNDAVEEALCFGWIDSIAKTIDNERYKQKYTPRRKNSIWSKLNKSRVEKMIKQGLMTEHGLKKIEEAKENGQWDKAYGSYERPEVKLPDELKKALQKNKKAWENFQNFAKSYQSTYITWYSIAKREETKMKRLTKIVEFAEKNQKSQMM